MNFKKLLHVLAILFSSLVSMLSYGHLKPEPAKKAKKGGESELSRKDESNSDEQSAAEAADPPPRTGAPLKLDPALMASAELSTPLPIASTITAVSYTSPVVDQVRYPWKRQIVTTTFWIGETPTKRNPVPNHKSSWDEKWARNYGGMDDPDPANRSNYLPVNFTPKQNPFYVALPYNDLEKGGRKSEASRVIPWFKEADQGDNKSVCKGRWIAIRFKDKVAYAQWEDAGPFRTDHWEYVFGNERPKPNLNRGAGLDVSPAVRDYLGMNDTDVTDWRFVDFDEVPQGPWAMHGDNNTFVMNARTQEMRLAQSKASPRVMVRE